MSAIAAVPLPPRPRGNNKGEMTAPAPQYYRRKFPIVAGNITRLRRVTEPGSSTFILRGGSGGVTDTKIWREPGFTISIRYWLGRSRNGESTSTGSRRWDSAL